MIVFIYEINGQLSLYEFKGFMDQDFVGVDTTTMLNQLSNTFKLQYNMNFLEWIFDKCGECDIVKKCKAFSEENQLKLECFDTNYTPRK